MLCGVRELLALSLPYAPDRIPRRLCASAKNFRLVPDHQLDGCSPSRCQYGALNLLNRQSIDYRQTQRYLLPSVAAVSGCEISPPACNFIYITRLRRRCRRKDDPAQPGRTRYIPPCSDSDLENRPPAAAMSFHRLRCASARRWLCCHDSTIAVAPLPRRRRDKAALNCSDGPVPGQHNFLIAYR